MPKKPVLYSVETTLAIANEMARYEGGRIVNETMLTDARNIEVAEYFADDTMTYRSMVKYNVVIESPYCNTKRWASFGVVPITIKYKVL